MSSVRSVASAADGAHLILYDGICGLCQSVVQFVLAHDRAQVFRFASLQSSIGRSHVERAGSNPDDLTTFYVVSDYRTADARVLAKGRSALLVATELGWPWKAIGAFGVLPTPLLDRLYDLVARNRYRLFGRREECLAPQPEYQSRFID